MRALVQRVSRATVRVDGSEVSAIGPGLLVLLGIAPEDCPQSAERLTDKLRALRIFSDAEGRMNDALGERQILCVSQFTLYGDASRGNRPSFTGAARAEHAEPLYERALQIWEQASSAEPEDIAAALTNLAMVRQERGAYAHARPCSSTRWRSASARRTRIPSAWRPH